MESLNLGPPDCESKYPFFLITYVKVFMVVCLGKRKPVKTTDITYFFLLLFVFKLYFITLLKTEALLMPEF